MQSDFIHISKSDRSLKGVVRLDGSKSISNRALIVLALAGADPALFLSNLSGAKDTQTLLRLLQQDPKQDATYDAGDAGTTFRFLTAYLALQPGVKTLTGSARMKERPVGPLVQALKDLGADITFLEKEGYPPLRIGSWNQTGESRPQIRIKADTSSQFLSALLLIAPYLPQGLQLIPEGNLVSKPYLQMTIKLMAYFGVEAIWDENGIHVEPGKYEARAFQVEADWSAASYWYALAAFSEDLDLRLQGLFEDSWQGDSVISTMCERLGLVSTFSGDEVRIRKSGQTPRPVFEWNFIECPDIAQTLAVICAGLGIQGLFCGLETLSIKETDRVAALKAELAKVGVSFSKLPPHFNKKSPDDTYFMCSGKATWGDAIPCFATYEDHRMAMSFAPMVMFNPVQIEHPRVVGKSYPGFWEDLKAFDVEIEG